MAVYPGMVGGNIGSLLRKIQEEKTQGAAIPPGTEPASATREMVQQPIMKPESPGTSRVVSIKSEMTSPTSPAGQQNIMPQSAGIGPIAIGGPEVMAPALRPSINKSVGNPSAPAEPQVMTPASRPSAPQGQILGTQITARLPSVTNTPIPDYVKYDPTSDNEMIARSNKTWETGQKNIAAIDKQLNATTKKDVEGAKQEIQKAKQIVANYTPTPTPTPTPAPQQPTNQKTSSSNSWITKSPWSYIATKIFGR